MTSFAYMGFSSLRVASPADATELTYMSCALLMFLPQMSHKLRLAYALPQMSRITQIVRVRIVLPQMSHR